MELNNMDMRELSDDELDGVSGGVASVGARSNSNMMMFACPKCDTVNNVDISKSSFTCIHCKTVHRIDG